MAFTIQKECFTFHSFIGGYDKNITYLIQTQETERVWAVDASIPIGNVPGELKNRIAGIFITHTHGDHISYLDQFVSENPEIDIYLFAFEVGNFLGSHNIKINIISMIEKASNGNLEIDGKIINHKEIALIDKVRSEVLGVLFESKNLLTEF